MHRQTKVQRASTRQETNTTLHTNSTNKRTQPTTWPIETTTQHIFTIGNTHIQTHTHHQQFSTRIAMFNALTRGNNNNSDSATHTHERTSNNDNLNEDDSKEEEEQAKHSSPTRQKEQPSARKAVDGDDVSFTGGHHDNDDDVDRRVGGYGNVYGSGGGGKGV
ncbi:putative uncharacterized protein DDB_G0292330 [Calliphora vicina]|uniref:putative uncharacterized protein DDB_G0292330 n=1 Tax=Calliphora vicina TaxID=7373 RepID=UPI00325A5E3E